MVGCQCGFNNEWAFEMQCEIILKVQRRKLCDKWLGHDSA